MRAPDFTAAELLDLLRHYPSGITAKQIVHQFGYSPPSYEFQCYRAKVVKRLEMLLKHNLVSHERIEPNTALWRVIQ